MNKGVFVLGAFGYSNNQLDGQTIKTRNIYHLLKNRCDRRVEMLDTIEVRRKPWLLFALFYYLFSCKVLVIIPCLNNLTYLFPITYSLSKILRYDIVSICIGGWQVEYFEGDNRFKPHPKQLRYSKNIRAFLPEMEKVNIDLKERLGFENTDVLPNFRPFDLIEIPQGQHEELRLVFMARINKKKGYPVVFKALDKIGDSRVKVQVTFYGQIAEEDKDDFFELLKLHSGNTKYEGALSPISIQDHLIRHDVLILPTQYYTEGFPGSILDAYIAGIPVIVTEWKHSHEFVIENKTGFIVPFGESVDEIVEKIKVLYFNRNLLQNMKINAREKSKKYSEDAAWNVLKKYL